MMNIEPIKKWFGYDRKERRASFILLLVIACILLIRYMYPEKNNDVQDISALLVRDTATSPVSYGMMMPQKAAQPKQEKTAVRKLINLNSCDSAMLETLPGSGPVLSARIIKYRNLIGGYSKIEQLREVYGLPPETYELIRTRVFAET
jgi:DNA uptake protein ComE-like DNA-binding protein